jgi:hypothetical protein
MKEEKADLWLQNVKGSGQKGLFKRLVLFSSVIATESTMEK